MMVWISFYICVEKKYGHDINYLIFRIPTGLYLYSTLEPLTRISIEILWTNSPYVLNIIIAVIDHIDIKIIDLVFWLE